MTAPKTVTANYVVQYLLTFGQSGINLATGSNTVVTVDGSPKPSGVLPFQKWYDTGATATYTYASPVFTEPTSATQFTLTAVTGREPTHRHRPRDGDRNLRHERLHDSVLAADRTDHGWSVRTLARTAG